MERCKTCGSELTLQPGVVVEVVPSPWVGLAVLLWKETNISFWRMVLITGPHRGERIELVNSDFRAVHGYIHIDRDGLLRADKRYCVGRSFEAIPVRSAFDDATYNI